MILNLDNLDTRPHFSDLNKSVTNKHLFFQLVDVQTDTLHDSFASDKRHTQIIHLFGVTNEGHSICVNVTDFKTFFYVPAIKPYTEDQPNALKAYINSLDSLKQITIDRIKVPTDPVLSVHMKKGNSLLHYEPDGPREFIELKLAHSSLVYPLKKILDHGFNLTLNGKPRFVKYESFETNWNYIYRFLTASNISGGCWVSMNLSDKSKFQKVSLSNKIANCQIELNASHTILSNATRTPPPCLNLNTKEKNKNEIERDFSAIKDIKVLSFDIECAMRENIFPDPTIDPIIQIGVCVMNALSNPFNDKEVRRTIFCFKNTSSIPGSKVISFKTEREMLSSFSNYLNRVDPDVITGYNIIGFDFIYFFKRCVALDIREALSISRLKTKPLKVPLESKAFNIDARQISCPGRVILDCFPVIKQQHNLSSYSLNSVSSVFLKEQKEDVHYSIITTLWKGNEDDRKRLASYCLKDALLPLKLCYKLMLFVNSVEMSRVTGITITDALYAGQQLKMFSLLYTRCKEPEISLFIPSPKSVQNEGGYEGAICIDPLRGFYNRPIVTLDFASLYPSIMLAHNICYSTLVPPQHLNEEIVKKCDKSPVGFHFIHKSTKRGVLPIILESLLEARRNTRQKIKEIGDSNPNLVSVLNGRQIAYKYVANSIYGVTGTSNGRLPCLEVSSSVTSYGREMIMETAKLVEENFTHTKVIYGDTDSVMVDIFHNIDPPTSSSSNNKKGNKESKESKEDDKTMMEAAFKFGKDAEALINKHFISPLRIEFEKVYYPYLLINKKRYVGMHYTKIEAFDKMDAKGIEIVRRDNCKLVRDVLKTTLNKVLIERDVKGALEYVKEMVARLVHNKIDLSSLIITKSLSAEVKDYKVKTPQSELAAKITARSTKKQNIAIKKSKEAESSESVKRTKSNNNTSTETGPRIGDRVAYVIIRTGDKNTKVYEKAEDPLYALEHNLPIDTEYYLQHQLALPLGRILEPIVGNINKVLYGAHTQYTKNTIRSNSKMAKFVTVKELCKGKRCRNPLKVKNTALCEKCVKDPYSSFLKVLKDARADNVSMSRQWITCQVTHDEINNEILCSNNDCAIYYSRTKAIKDQEESSKKLDSFKNQFKI